MRISDWSSDVCSSDLPDRGAGLSRDGPHAAGPGRLRQRASAGAPVGTSPPNRDTLPPDIRFAAVRDARLLLHCSIDHAGNCAPRSEEHTSEVQSLMRISYAVFCLKKKKHYRITQQLKHS